MTLCKNVYIIIGVLLKMKQNKYFVQAGGEIYMIKRKKGNIILVTLFLIVGIILIIYFWQKINIRIYSIRILLLME